MLSLVTTPDRAASTVGDLIEDPATGGTIRFWSSIMFTVVALLWRDLAASPRRMTGLALYGLVLQFFFAFLFLLVMIGAGMVFGRDSRTFAQFDPSALPGAIGITLFTLTAQYQIGRALAKRAPGHELTPCVATTMLGYAIPIALVIMAGNRLPLPTGQLLSELPRPTLLQIAFNEILPLLALFAGAVRLRRQQLSIQG